MHCPQCGYRSPTGQSSSRTCLRCEKVFPASPGSIRKYCSFECSIEGRFPNRKRIDIEDRIRGRYTESVPGDSLIRGHVSTRVTNALANAGIRRVSDLKNYTDQDLLEVKEIS